MAKKKKVDLVCPELVAPHGSMRSYACGRTAGHGPGGAYCKMHSRKHEAFAPTTTIWIARMSWKGILFGPLKVRETKLYYLTDGGSELLDHRSRVDKTSLIWHKTEAEATAAMVKMLESCLSDSRKDVTKFEKLLKEWRKR